MKITKPLDSFIERSGKEPTSSRSGIYSQSNQLNIFSSCIRNAKKAQKQKKIYNELLAKTNKQKPDDTSTQFDIQKAMGTLSMDQNTPDECVNEYMTTLNSKNELSRTAMKKNHDDLITSLGDLLSSCTAADDEQKSKLKDTTKSCEEINDGVKKLAAPSDSSDSSSDGQGLAK